MIPACYPFPESLVNWGDHLRQRRLELGWTQKRTATRLGISEDALRNWELGKAEPKVHRLPLITEFLGYELTNDRDEVATMISEIRNQTGISYEILATEIGVCADTLVNLKNGRYQPTQRTYQRLTAYAQTLNT